jgi:hypothetical protein
MLRLMLMLAGAVLWAAATARGADEAGGGPIAAGHPADLGIADDPAVVFADDFEGWTDGGTAPPAGKSWSVRKNEVSVTHVIPGKVSLGDADGPGEGVLEIACWTPGEGARSQTGGMSLKLGNYNNADEGLGPGYDDLYIRYYIRFDEKYKAVQNHGANLGGRDVTRPGSNWVGMANVPDPSTKGYFYSGLQPRGERGTQQLRMGFYSYHLDKRGGYGASYPAVKEIPITVGRWYCLERHLKLNSINAETQKGNFDGMEELWVDGELSIRQEGLRFRHVPEIHISFFSLENYYHGLPDEFGKDNPIRVYYDNLVIATSPIGPIRSADE